jgi:polyisoprenyl-teichoic acid--peptidoglycan teichoic acid transferase
VEKRYVLIAAGLAVALAGLSVGAVLLFGHSGEGSAASSTSTTTTTTVAATSTTAAAPTTTSPTTTTTLPGPALTLTLSGAGQLQDAAESFYAWIGDREGVEAPRMAEGLAAFLADVTVPADQALTGAFETADLADGKRVAVITAGGDVVLAADEGDGQGWTIVGARLATLGLEAWYGNPVRYVMAIGTDARPGYIERVFRADSIHLLTSNIAEHAGAVVGFPRDTYVDTPYGRKDKLSSVNARADTEALVDIVRDLSGLPIEGYVITGFQSFRRMVDDFGGVVVNVPFAMADHHSSAYLSAGQQTLWGQNALAFSRNRHLNGGDFTRCFHQGLVILGALAGVQLRGLDDLPELLALLSQYTWTDLSAGDLLTLTAGAYEIDPLAVANLVLPGSVQTISGASVVILDDSVEGTYRDLDDGIITPEE